MYHHWPAAPASGHRCQFHQHNFHNSYYHHSSHYYNPFLSWFPERLRSTPGGGGGAPGMGVSGKVQMLTRR